MEKIKVGLVGISNHGVTIRNAVKKCDKFQIEACYDINDKELEVFCSSVNCIKAKNYEEIINNPKIDAIILVSPNFLHLEQGLKAIEKNKHLFIEKPITNFVEEGIDLYKSAQKKNIILQVGHNMRKKVNYRMAKNAINEKRIGDVVSFYANFSHDGGFNPNMPSWKADVNRCPLLPMMQLGIHFVDTLHFLFGETESVYCETNNFAMPEKVLDSTCANIKMKNGVIGSLQSHYVIPPIFEFKIFGTKGTIYCYEGTFEIETFDEGKKIFDKIIIDELKFSSFEKEIEDFAECIIKKEQPETDGLVGIKALSVIEAMILSSREKRLVKISEIFNN